MKFRVSVKKIRADDLLLGALFRECFLKVV